MTHSMGPQSMAALGHSSMLFSPNRAVSVGVSDNFVMNNQANEIVEERGRTGSKISVEEMDSDGH